MRDDTKLTNQLKAETTCRGCGGEKGIGLVVCWDCFKNRKDFPVLKYYVGTTAQWLQEIAALKTA